LLSFKVGWSLSICTRFTFNGLFFYLFYNQTWEIFNVGLIVKENMFSSKHFVCFLAFILIYTSFILLLWIRNKYKNVKEDVVNTTFSAFSCHLIFPLSLWIIFCGQIYSLKFFFTLSSKQTFSFTFFLLHLECQICCLLKLSCQERKLVAIEIKKLFEKFSSTSAFLLWTFYTALFKQGLEK
jgi:hypothetical protein